MNGSKSPNTSGNEVKKRRFCCYVCDVGVSTKVYLKQHMLIHSRERPFVCIYCNEAFNRKSTLKDHIILHESRSEYKCEHCCKSFLRERPYVLHMKEHSITKPFSCDQCGESFKFMNPLKEHLRTHSLEVPPECNGKSAGSSSVNNSKDTPSEAGSFKCEKCGLEFTTTDQLSVEGADTETPRLCSACFHSPQSKSLAQKARQKRPRKISVSEVSHGRILRSSRSHLE